MRAKREQALLDAARAALTRVEALEAKKRAKEVLWLAAMVNGRCRAAAPADTEWRGRGGAGVGHVPRAAMAPRVRAAAVVLRRDRARAPRRAPPRDRDPRGGRRCRTEP